MIIGQFCDVYPPELDGVGMVVKSYVEELSALGDECYYVAPHAAANGQSDFRALFFRSIKIPHEPYHVGIPLLDPRYMKRAADIPFDLVHAHSPFIAGREALRLARKRDIPLVATFHSKYYDDFYGKTHSKHLAAIGTNVVVDFYNQCDEVWAVSEKTASVLREYGYKREIHIAANGTCRYEIAPQDVRAAEERFELGEEPVFLFVGQMNWKKNIRKILEAVALYARTAPCRLVMAGQGPDEKAIRECAESLGIGPLVVFAGHIADRKLLMGLFSRADMLVFPSVYDNAPMVVREAAMAGTPAILMRGSCATEGIQDGVNGLLCEDSAQSIADCMARGLAIKDVLGKNARYTIPIEWNTIIRPVRERYVTLIEEKKRAGE